MRAPCDRGRSAPRHDIRRREHEDTLCSQHPVNFTHHVDGIGFEMLQHFAAHHHWEIKRSGQGEDVLLGVEQINRTFERLFCHPLRSLTLLRGAGLPQATPVHLRISQTLRKQGRDLHTAPDLEDPVPGIGGRNELKRPDQAFPVAGYGTHLSRVAASMPRSGLTGRRETRAGTSAIDSTNSLYIWAARGQEHSATTQSRARVPISRARAGSSKSHFRHSVRTDSSWMSGAIRRHTSSGSSRHELRRRLPLSVQVRMRASWCRRFLRK